VTTPNDFDVVCAGIFEAPMALESYEQLDGILREGPA
jgi:hypothetical protein